MNSISTQKSGVMKDQEKKWNPSKETQYTASEQSPTRPNIQPGAKIFAKGTAKDGNAKAIATVDQCDGESFIKLTKGDSQNGKHYWIPLGWVEKTDNVGIYLNKSEDEFTRGLQNEPPGHTNEVKILEKEKMAI